MFDKVIYHGVIKRDTAYEYCEAIVLTEEVNGYAVWHMMPDGSFGGRPVRWFRSSERDAAIESAVDIASKHRED